jgi:hypothetical protein
VAVTTTTSSLPPPTPSSTTLPGCDPSGPVPAALPAAAQIEPLLLTAADVPVGYTSTGPQTTSPSGVPFSGALPASVPVAYVSFSLGSGPTGPYYDIAEALGQAASPTAAMALVHQTKAAAHACGFSGTTVDLPGTVANLTATTFIGGTSDEDTSSAIAVTAQGPYVLEVSWLNSLTTYPDSPPPAQPPLPSTDQMGSIMDAALAQIPD